MSDLTPKAVYSAYREDQKSGPLARPLFVARILAISVACLGAIPTAMTFYHSWAHGIPYSQVSHRLEQYDLWVKNFDCKIDYRTVGTTPGSKVDVGACPKSGDIALKITTPAGKAAYEWIGFEQLQKSSQQASLLSYFITEAQADELPKTAGAGIGQPAAPAGAPTAVTNQNGLPSVRFAQSTGGTGGLQVVCQAMLPEKGKALRIVNEGGKCFREHISLFQGKVDKKEEVQCSTTCAPGGKG